MVGNVDEWLADWAERRCARFPHASREDERRLRAVTGGGRRRSSLPWFIARGPDGMPTAPDRRASSAVRRALRRAVRRSPLPPRPRRPPRGPYVWSVSRRGGGRRFYFDFGFGTSLSPSIGSTLVRRVLCVHDVSTSTSVSDVPATRYVACSSNPEAYQALIGDAVADRFSGLLRRETPKETGHRGPGPRSAPAQATVSRERSRSSSCRSDPTTIVGFSHRRVRSSEATGGGVIRTGNSPENPNCYTRAAVAAS